MELERSVLARTTQLAGELTGVVLRARSRCASYPDADDPCRYAGHGRHRSLRKAYATITV